jgi:hypothetical protein
VKIALIYPPTGDPTAPYLAVPMLTGFLRHHGVEVVPIDANVEAWDALLRPEALAPLAARVEARCLELEALPMLDHEAQRTYLQLVRSLPDAAAAPAGIAEARAVFKDRTRFFDPDDYEAAVATVESACRLVSAAYAPLDLSFSGYRTPFALTTPDEIARDASAERNPFHGWVAEVLAPRLRREQVDAVGISFCFPGQLQPAFALGLQLRELLPDVHLTAGGPALTQLLIKLSGQDLARALGPFDSAVVFEGEHTLLALCRALAAKRPLRDLPNVVVRDPLLGARYLPGHSSEDLRQLPAPDFDGLPLDLYFAPELTLPYDPTRGCYWGKCTFCHYGLAEVGTASYRERPVEAQVEHLAALSQKYGTRRFYLSQDSVAPKTLLKLSEALVSRGLELRWATDLKPERYLTAERAETLRRAGAVACALGVESGSERVLGLIDKGQPVPVVRSTIDHLAQAGIAVEAMCFTDFPTETLDEALDTVRLLDDKREQVALYILGEFDLTAGARVSRDPAQFGLRDTWTLDGDLLKTGLFYEEAVPSKSPDEVVALDEALFELGQGWKLRRYPWAGSLSTAHTVAWYDRGGPGVFRALAARQARGPFGARPLSRVLPFDYDSLLEAEQADEALWQHLVRERRHVSRAAYEALAAARPVLARRRLPRSYGLVAGIEPKRLRSGRRPDNAQNAAG